MKKGNEVTIILIVAEDGGDYEKRRSSPRRWIASAVETSVRLGSVADPQPHGGFAV